jgi:hypothetical protein
MKQTTIDFIKRQTMIVPMNPDPASAKAISSKSKTSRPLMGFKQFIEEQDKLLSDLR